MNALKPPPHVIAVGYSVRALVEACANANVVSIAVDHFGDADTRAAVGGRWLQLSLDINGLAEKLLQDLNATAASIRQAGGDIVIMLAGGMENQSVAVEQLRKVATVFGPTQEQLWKLRDGAFLQEIAIESGLSFPRSSFTHAASDALLNRLWKPYASAGGLKIARFKNDGDQSAGYWQEFIDGEQVGAICLATRERTQLLGFTGGFNAADWLGPTEFIYRGSWGPIALSDDLQCRVESMSDRIRKRIGYRGWLQFDFIRNSENLHLLECNPRWTSGMEVLEKSSRRQPFTALLQSNGFNVESKLTNEHCEGCFFAKAIVYAEKPLYLSEACVARLGQIDGLADLPFTPQVIEKGHPIATVYAQLSNDSRRADAEIRAQLLVKMRERKQRLLEAIAYDN